jgi:hypothetical protein
MAIASQLACTVWDAREAGRSAKCLRSLANTFARLPTSALNLSITDCTLLLVSVFEKGTQQQAMGHAKIQHNIEQHVESAVAAAAAKFSMNSFHSASEIPRARRLSGNDGTRLMGKGTLPCSGISATTNRFSFSWPCFFTNWSVRRGSFKVCCMIYTWPMMRQHSQMDNDSLSGPLVAGVCELLPSTAHGSLNG